MMYAHAGQKQLCQVCMALRLCLFSFLPPNLSNCWRAFDKLLTSSEACRPAAAYVLQLADLAMSVSATTEISSKNAGEQSERDDSFSFADSQYSFASAVQGQPGSGHFEAASAAGGSKRKRDAGNADSTKGKRDSEQAKHKTVKGTQCELCTQPCAAGHSRCWPHKRAYDCIQKQCWRARKKDAALEEQPKAYQEWVAIFGEGRAGPPDQMLANQVVLDFAEKYPDGQSKLGQKRGQAQLITYIHSHLVTASSSKSIGLPLWDFELFVNQMKNFRGWSQTQSKQQWDALEREPSNFRDNQGPAKHPRRIAIPAWLSGTESHDFTLTEAEEKRVSTAGRSLERSMEDRQQMIGELRQGFERVPRAVITKILRA